MSLYEQINASIDAVTDFSNLVWFGLILNQVNFSAFDTLITSKKDASDWSDVASVKRQAELCGYHSPTIDDCTKDFLTNQPMFSTYKLPDTDNGWFYILHPYVLHGYRWAKELQHETTKWDAESGYTGLHNVFSSANKVFYRCNPDTGEYDQLNGGRMYEHNQLGNCFWIFWRDGEIADAKQDLATCWTYLNNNNWSSDHFIYAPNNPNWVWDGPQEALEVFGRLHMVDDACTPNFARLDTHMQNGFLASYWNSNHFVCSSTQYHFVVHHNSSNSQRRMRGQLLAIVFLWQMWNRMTDSQKTAWRDMIMGTGNAHAKGWEVMLESGHGMFDSATDKFKLDSTDTDTSDEGTARGALALFLLGIAPSTTSPGSLAFPLETNGLGSLTMINPRHFLWDGEQCRIRIPVYAGNLTFLYGSENVTHNFPRDGVYEVWFNNDYTAITKTVQVGLLDIGYYLDPPLTTHRFWKRLSASRGLKTTAVWRKLVLIGERDGVTGWFKKRWQESNIDVVVSSIPKASYNILNIGSYSDVNLKVVTPSPVQPGDELIVFARVYTVETVREFIWEEKLTCYEASCKLKELSVFA